METPIRKIIPRTIKPSLTTPVDFKNRFRSKSSERTRQINRLRPDNESQSKENPNYLIRKLDEINALEFDNLSIKEQLISFLYKTINNGKIVSHNIETIIDLDTIKTNQYRIYPKFIGPELLWTFKQIDGMSLLLIINKNDLKDEMDKIDYNTIRIYTLKLQIQSDYYNNTIFDGNLVMINDNLTFIINNVYLVKGTKPMNFDKINNLVNNFNDVPHKLIDFKINKSHQLSELIELIEKIKTNKLLEGLYFIGKINYHFIINKNEEITIEGVFLIKKNNVNLPDVYDLYLNNDGKLIQLDKIAYIKDKHTSLLIQSALEKDESECVVRCRYNTKFKKWQILNILMSKELSEYDELINKIKIYEFQ